MSIIFIVVLILLAFVVYLYLCMLAAVFVTTPLAIAGALGGALAGPATTLIRTGAVLVGHGTIELRTPADVAAGRLPGRVGLRQIRRDRAWPQYFVVQVKLDLEEAIQRSWRSVVTAWSWSNRNVRRMPHRVALALWPILLPVLVALLAYTATTLAAVTAVSLLSAAVTAVAWPIGILVVGLLRGLDRTWQQLARAGASCPRCYEVSRLPAYRCAGPHPAQDRRDGWDLHRDVRPGRLGVLWRRCGCGRRLPTMVLRANRAMVAHCPRCSEPLHRGAGVDTDVRIPVFGAASAGKTHLIVAGLVTLLRSANDSQLRIGVADEHSERLYRGYAELVDQDAPIPKTNPSQQPVAVTLRLRSGPRRAMVHVFDAAGEALADPEQNARLTYLDYARTLVFVLDPFSVPAVRDGCAASHADLFRLANAAADKPESAYQVTVGRLRGYGVDTTRKRLAFVVSKLDLLAELPIVDQLTNDGERVREWLIARELDNLVIAAERDFGEVRYFVTSAKRDTGGTGAAEPFRWLLERERVPTPPRPPELVRGVA